MSSRPKRKPKALTPKEIQQFFDILAEHIDPESELQWETPLDLAVAVMLSAQCTDKAVNKATAKLWERCRTPQDYLDLGTEDLQQAVRSIGLFRNKTQNILGMCRMLLDEFDGELPDSREELMKLPGIGRKSANVILNVVFKQPTLAVDTHVFRVANRVGLAWQPTPKKTELQLLQRIPEQHRLHAHHYLILHGRYTCTARRPKCPDCPVAHVCNFRNKTETPEKQLG